MAEIFLGELPQVNLYDVLKPLLTDKKTGRMVFKGKEKGEIYIEGGNIIHAKTSRSSGEYALFTVVEWKEGRIFFKPDIRTKEKTLSISTERLIQNWQELIQQWQRIREAIPSTNLVFRLHSKERRRGQEH